jgi:hypothetical protein
LVIQRFLSIDVTMMWVCIPRMRDRMSRENPPIREVTTTIVMMPTATPTMEK